MKQCYKVFEGQKPMAYVCGQILMNITKTTCTLLRQR